MILCLSSCVYNHTDNTENLGNKYFYLGDGSESQIMLGDEKKNFGVTIVPQEVVEYNFNDRYIIAKSIAKTDNIEIQKFWLIDKKSNDSIISLDSLSFHSKLEKLNIRMKLKIRK